MEIGKPVRIHEIEPAERPLERPDAPIEPAPRRAPQRKEQPAPSRREKKEPVPT